MNDKTPPVGQRFKKGRSGNPKGRPKKPKPFGVLIDRELKKMISVTENGTRMRITKRQALCKVLAGKALSGNKKIRRLTFDLLRQIDRDPKNYQPIKIVTVDDED